MAVAADMEDSRTDANCIRDGPRRPGRPHSAYTFSTRTQSSGDSSSSECLKQYRPWVSPERWKELRKMSETASKDKKVFLIKGGGFSPIRHALVERGWIEKFEAIRPRPLQPPLPTELPAQDPLAKPLTEPEKLVKMKCERAIMHKFLEHQPIDFLWTTKRDRYDWLLVKRDVMISRFCRANFTSKEGLCLSLNQMYWFTEPGVSVTRFPRCYNLHNSDQLEEFIEDFRLTACIGLCKWLLKNFSSGGPEAVVSSNGRVPYSAIEFAITRLNEYLMFVSHKDIDEAEDKMKRVWEHEWDQFLTHHYILIHENSKLLEETNVCVSVLECCASKVVTSLEKYWPQMDLDGIMNIWIVKPGNKCRGKGIQLMNNIKDIIGIVNLPIATKARFVVQKYIENPLIVYNTKFDIRQWFLITNSQPLTIWMYRDSYLRFSSQIFNLSNYHESVHLTNNAVQSKYKNHQQRDKALPDENMWDCHTFKTYLRQIGKSDMWEERIYPGMRECLVGAMLACQDTMDRRQNSFELYGADFMLTEDFTPWLIEINSSPDLAPTTSVTARLCPQCLEDIIKVVIDRKNNPEADTGMFECIYKQVIPRAPAYLGLSLAVSGKKIFKKNKIEKPKVDIKEREFMPVSASKTKSESLQAEVEVPSDYTGPIITDLMAWLKPLESAPKEIEKKETPTIHHALTVVKSGLLLKTSTKAKRKSTSTVASSRNRGAKKDKNQNVNCKTPPNNFCCRNDMDPLAPNFGLKEKKKKYKYDEKCFEKINWNDPNTLKSVGNKRCYIEPATWERDTASILRSSSMTFQQNGSKIENKQIVQVTPRIFSPGIVSFSKLYPMLRKNLNGTNIDLEGSKTFSGIGLNIKRLKHCKRENQSKKTNETKIITTSTSFYGPYKTVATPDALPD